MIDQRRPDFANTPVAAARAQFGYAPATGGAGTPAVAVVTPFFNTSEVFHQTAASVLRQSLQNFEWIIVNDGTTDEDSLELLAEYRTLAATDPRVRVVDHHANAGVSAARNTGFRSSRAPLVFLLDSDDLIEPTALEKCALFLEVNTELAFVKGKTVGFGGLEYLWEGGFHDGAAILDRNPITTTAMIRRSVYDAIGGFDETIRGGLEDREFWIRAAGEGHWGATIHEFLDWYRRRHGGQAMDFWPNLASKEKKEDFTRQWRQRYPALFAGRFPSPRGAGHAPNAAIPERVAFSNPLAKKSRRLLMVVPWLRQGGADKCNLDLIAGLSREGWEVTVATTLPWHPWLPEFTRLTPDVFMLDHIGSVPEYPRLLRYLIESRDPDVVMITNSEVGYFTLPFLRTHCPRPAYVDLNHMEEMYWKDGGHPRQGAGMQGQLDLSITISEHLKQWMVARGADVARTEVCRLNVDTLRFAPDPAARMKKRRELGIDDGTVAILYPARLTAQKQPMVLAEVVRRLAAKRPLGSPRFVALAAGDGEMRAQVDEFIHRHRLHEHLRMLGPVPVGDMPALYNAADIVFLPSLHEGIALTLYEAMATGLPVVGANVGGQPELVVEGTGLLLPPNDDKAAEAAAYVAALRTLIDDRGLREQTGRAAFEHVRANHGQERTIRRMLELFDLAAHHQRTSPRVALPARLAQDIAENGIEWLRARDLMGELEWHRKRIADAEADSHRRAHHHRAAASQALAHIESSRTWRLVQSAKHTALYRWWARRKYGAEWQNVVDVKLPPDEKLAHIRGSRTYKLLATMKRLPPVKMVSRARHGPEFRNSIPELIRHD